MKEFLLILFFSKTFLLTPDPVNFIGEMELFPEEPLSAITSGASLQIDVSNFTKGINIKNNGIIESRKLLKEIIPEGSVNAILYSKDGEVPLDESGFALSNSGVILMLSSKTGVPVDIEFDKVKIISRIEFKDVQVYWKNFKL